MVGELLTALNTSSKTLHTVFWLGYCFFAYLALYLTSFETESIYLSLSSLVSMLASSGSKVKIHL